MTDSYNSLVRRCFANPVHAGNLSGRYNTMVRAEAEEAGTGIRVILSAAVEAGKVGSMRFQAFGCPHLIAAAELFCEEVEGQPVAALRLPEMRSLMERLDVPVTKTGRLFVLEDAAEALHMRLSEPDKD